MAQQENQENSSLTETQYDEYRKMKDIIISQPNTRLSSPVGKPDDVRASLFKVENVETVTANMSQKYKMRVNGEDKEIGSDFLRESMVKVIPAGWLDSEDLLRDFKVTLNTTMDVISHYFKLVNKLKTAQERANLKKDAPSKIKEQVEKQKRIMDAIATVYRSVSNLLFYCLVRLLHLHLYAE